MKTHEIARLANVRKCADIRAAHKQQILRKLISGGKSILELHEQLEGVCRKTVYRCIAEMCDSGVIKAYCGGNMRKYRLAIHEKEIAKADASQPAPKPKAAKPRPAKPEPADSLAERPWQIQQIPGEDGRRIIRFGDGWEQRHGIRGRSLPASGRSALEYVR